LLIDSNISQNKLLVFIKVAYIIMIEHLKSSGYVLDPHNHIWSRRGFSGILYNDGDAVEQNIASIIKQAGFISSEFLAPFPDYKFPVSILTEKGINYPDFDASALAWQSAHSDAQLPPYCNFSLELASENSWEVQCNSGSFNVTRNADG
jgi:hypothetical protein